MTYTFIFFLCDGVRSVRIKTGDDGRTPARLGLGDGVFLFSWTV